MEIGLREVQELAKANAGKAAQQARDQAAEVQREAKRSAAILLAIQTRSAVVKKNKRPWYM